MYFVVQKFCAKCHKILLSMYKVYKILWQILVKSVQNVQNDHVVSHD